MNITPKEVGERIREARKAQKLSQAELAEQLNISPSHMSDIENGKTNPGLDIFIKIIDVLKVSADWLLCTNSPIVNTLQNEELHTLLSGCSSKESQTLLKIMTEIKAALQSARKEHSDYY